MVRRHIARNAILPVVTLAGLQAGQLVGGAVLTETVFAWPGIGRLMFDALAQRDYQVLLGVFFVSSAMVVRVQSRRPTSSTAGPIPIGRAWRRRDATSRAPSCRNPRRASIGARHPPRASSPSRCSRPFQFPASPFRLVGRPVLAPFALERFPLGTDALGRDVARRPHARRPRLAR